MSLVFFATSMDPFHLGHHETVMKLRESFGHVIVGLGVNPEKPSGLFTPQERIQIARLSLPRDIEVQEYSGATLRRAEAVRATALGRGLRTGYDLQYEAELQFQNEALGAETKFPIPTVYVLTTRYPYISSSRVREFIRLRAGRESLSPYLCEKAIEWILDEGYVALDARKA